MRIFRVFFMLVFLSFFVGCATTVVTSVPSGAEAYGYKQKSGKESKSGFEYIGRTPTSYYGGFVNENAFVIWPDGTKSQIQRAKEDKLGLSILQKKINFVHPTLLKHSPQKEYRGIADEEIERIHWGFTKEEDTIPMYREFINLFPNSRFLPQAQARLLELKDLALQSVKVIELQFLTDTDMMPPTIKEDIINQLEQHDLQVISSSVRPSDATLKIVIEGSAKKEKYTATGYRSIELYKESTISGTIELDVAGFSAKEDFSGNNKSEPWFSYDPNSSSIHRRLCWGPDGPFVCTEKEAREKLIAIIVKYSRPDYLSAFNKSDFKKKLSIILSRMSGNASEKVGTNRDVHKIINFE